MRWCQVPLHAPGTREQWREWTDAHWPLCWRPPEATKPSELEPLSDHEIIAMQMGMDAAYGVMEGGPASRELTNGAVIMDPVTGEVNLPMQYLLQCQIFYFLLAEPQL